MQCKARTNCRHGPTSFVHSKAWQEQPLGKPCKATRDFLEAKSAALHDKEETRTQIHGLQEDWQDGTSAGSLLRLMHNRTDIMSKSS